MMKYPVYCPATGRNLDEIRKECVEKGKITHTTHYGYSYILGHDEFFLRDGTVENDEEIKYCEYCGHLLADEDFIYSEEHHEFWGAPCSERILSGYKCSECGEEVRF